MRRSSRKGRYLKPESLRLAEELAAESIVLLKNERDMLPVAGGVRQIALIGPLADDRAALLGSWHQKGNPADMTSILGSMKERLPAGVKLRTARGCDIDGGSRKGFAEAVRLAKQSDLVLLCLGESAAMSGENASRSSIGLPGVQEDLALEVAQAGKPVVLVLSAGRPIELQRIEPKMDAILAIWQPGTRGGAAVADILLGRRNPSGRLAVTFPRTTGQIPIYHNMRPRARLGQQGGVSGRADFAPLSVRTRAELHDVRVWPHQARRRHNRDAPAGRSWRKSRSPTRAGATARRRCSGTFGSRPPRSPGRWRS